MRYAAMVTALGAGLLLANPALAEQSPTKRSPAGQSRTAKKSRVAHKQRTKTRATQLQATPEKKRAAIAEVVVLHGSNDGKGIDPRIGKLPQLEQPPFSSYDSYQLLKRSKLALKGDKPASMKLPDNGNFQLELKEVKGKKRYVLRASIIKADGKTFLPSMKVNARSGDIFFIAGQKYKGGIMVLGIRVKPAP